MPTSGRTSPWSMAIGWSGPGSSPLGARQRVQYSALGARGFASHLRYRRPRHDRRGRRLHLSRPADSRLLCEAGHRQHRELRNVAAAAVLRRPDGVRRRSEYHVRLPGAPGRAVLPQVTRGPALLQALRRRRVPQRSLQRRRRPRRSADPRRGRGGGAEIRGERVWRRPHLLRAERHEHFEQGRHQRAPEARRPGAFRPQQSQIAASGSAGAWPAPSRSSCRRRATPSA